MVSPRSWRNHCNVSNDEAAELQRATSRRLGRMQSNEPLENLIRAATGSPMLLSATNSNDLSSDVAAQMMNMGQHMLQPASMLCVRQFQEQQRQQAASFMQQQGSSSNAAMRRYPQCAAMQQQQQQYGHQHRRPSPNSSSAAAAPAPGHKHGMKDVPYWLKTLRLHKYTSMFAEMEYAQMMSLDERELEMRAVTKGARRKILQSIAKLRQRPANVRRLEATFDLNNDACLRCAIVELRQLVATPIMPYTPAPGRHETEEEIDGVCAIDAIPDENLPALMVRLLMRVYAQGVSGELPHDQIKPELLLMYFTICDRILMNEAFTSSQKRRIVQWRRAARRFAAPAELRRYVTPQPPPPRCDACAPVSTFYFNDSMEEIMRVQNLQRLVRQYLNSSSESALLPAQHAQQQQQAAISAAYFDAQAAHTVALQAATAAAARTQLQRDAALCGFNAAAAYSARPSPFVRRMMPRGGPVTTPPPNFYGPPEPLQQQQAARCCPSAAFQEHQVRVATAAAAAVAAAPAPARPWGLEGVYSSADVFELARPLDLDFTPAPSRSIWSNTPASSSSEDSVTSGYSSSSSERGSGAGSPRVADAVAAIASPDVAAFAFPAQHALVFDFSRNVEGSSLDAACRQIQEQLSFNH